MKLFRKILHSLADVLSVDSWAVVLLFFLSVAGGTLTAVGLCGGALSSHALAEFRNSFTLHFSPETFFSSATFLSPISFFLIGLGTLLLTFLIYLGSLRDPEWRAFLLGASASVILHVLLFFSVAEIVVGIKPDHERERREREIALNLLREESRAPSMVSDYFYGDLPGDEVFQDENETENTLDAPTGPVTGTPTVVEVEDSTLRDTLKQSEETLEKLAENANQDADGRTEMLERATTLAPTHAEISEAQLLKRQREMALPDAEKIAQADAESFQSREQKNQRISTDGLMSADAPTQAEAGEGTPEIVSAKTARVRKIDPREAAMKKLRVAEREQKIADAENMRGLKMKTDKEKEKELEALLMGTVDGVSDAVMDQTAQAPTQELGNILDSEREEILKNAVVFRFQKSDTPEMGFQPSSMKNGEMDFHSDGDLYVENGVANGVENGSEDGLEDALRPTMMSQGPDRNLLESGITLRAEPTLPYRQRVRRNHRKMIADAGGDPDSEQMVELGLQYLERNQFPDGRWSLNFLPKKDSETGNNPENTPDPLTRQEIGLGTIHADTAATGLSLLAYLGAGYTHLNTEPTEESDYAQTVNRGLNWLLRNQQADGSLFSEKTDAHRYGRIYSHGIATIALCEAYGMTRDARLREPAQRAVDFIVRAQAPEGGWRYTPEKNNGVWRGESDTSVSGWQAMALVSARMAGLKVPESAFQNLERWVRHAAIDGGRRFCYMPIEKPLNDEMRSWRKPTHAMTAEGMLMQLYLKDDPKAKTFQSAADFLIKNAPDVTDSRRDTYYWYYATQVMFHLQDERWQKWQSELVTTLRDTQETENPLLRGSWSPTQPAPDYWGQAVGRHYVTVMHLLMLEVYYRHLPLFQEL
ncbi:MAG: hypothetical protein Q4C70_06370 [Planctomycetia bacterium]|nr:hypothetical protein [Planctomycetia bacterium]